MTVSTAPDVAALTSELFKNSEEYIMFRIAKRVAELTPGLKAKGREPLKLSIGAPTLPPPKFIVDKLKEAIDEPGASIHVYSTTRGELDYRQAVALRMKNRFGVTVDAATETCSLVGSKEGLANMFRGLITPRMQEKQQDIILTPDPGYASYKGSINAAGGYSYPMPLLPDNKYCPDLETVREQLIKDGFDPTRIKAVIINYPSNPLGASAPFIYYEHVIAVAKKYNWLVISDNAYADLYYPGSEKPHSILEVEGAKDIAVEMFSLSKPYSMTGWRIGFAAGNRMAIDLLAMVKSTVDSGIFKAIQKAGAYALTAPEADKHIEEVGAVYAKSQAVFKEQLKRLGWPVEQITWPKATFYLWLPIPPRYDTCEAFANDLLETSGIVTVPGTAFGQNGQGYVRLSLVLPDEQLIEVVDRMEADGFTFDK